MFLHWISAKVTWAIMRWSFMHRLRTRDGNREFIASDMVRVNRLLKARQDVQVVFTSWRSAWSRFTLSAAMRNDFFHNWLQKSVQSKVNEVHSQSPRLQARIRVIARNYSLHVVTWYSLQHACHLLLRKPRCSISHHVQPIDLLHVGLYKKSCSRWGCCLSSGVLPLVRATLTNTLVGPRYFPSAV